MALANYLAEWTDPTPGVSFKIYDTIPTPIVVLASVPAGTFSTTVALEETTQHQVCVTAIGAGGESLPSNQVILAPAKPPAPTNFTLTKI